MFNIISGHWQTKEVVQFQLGNAEFDRKQSYDRQTLLLS